ncbi:phage protein [Escherichia coli]|nr:phage protein [Escherichia coli]
MSTEEAREMIQRYREAEMAVLEGKSVTFNGQQLTLEKPFSDPRRTSGVGTQACRDGEPQAGKTGI